MYLNTTICKRAVQGGVRGGAIQQQLQKLSHHLVERVLQFRLFWVFGAGDKEEEEEEEEEGLA